MKSYQYARCSFYGSGSVSRCPNKAAGLLYAPDGKPVPGGYLCTEHARIITEEYREKLHEEWKLKTD